MPEPSPLEQLGFSVVSTLAGFMGGVVRVFSSGRITPLESLSSIIVGALTANYIAPPATHWSGLPEAPTAFIIGLAGMQVVLVLTDAVKTWKAPKG
jgi:LytS/YehU family sensor histidine kinase